jgi:maltooligosyltrehalose trehalohydrolase
VLEDDGSSQRIPMQRQPSGLYEATIASARPGMLYRFSIDGQGPFPDPASRYQPHGVHGPSQLLEDGIFLWKHSAFCSPSVRELVLYEIHIGTFTPQGTFLSAIEKLNILHDLGVTAIELMPVADFPGTRNWGYDGVAIYAPAHTYGTPDQMRLLIDAAHERGIAVFLDVVYNHLGPDGAYHSVFAPQFYSKKHQTPWGDGLNFDDAGSSLVREFFLENALYWIREFHLDGLRVDATHAITDTREPHFLAELTTRLHAAAQDMHRTVLVIAEDDRNERSTVTPVEEGGLGFDAVWSDDFHHHMRHRLAGDHDGYFADFDGSMEHIVETVRDGWFFQGQYPGNPRGTSTKGLTPESRIFCLQNHDQVGNRALGERLSTQIDAAEYRAATALLLLAPETPLLFMGQEWAASEPFLFFTDHAEPLGRQVTEGRRREFSKFAAFTDPASRDKIPDPQARDTFLRSKLDWGVRLQADHAACWRWYQALLQWRHRLIATHGVCEIAHMDDSSLQMEWKVEADRVTVILLLGESKRFQQNRWRGLHLSMTSEDPAYCIDPKPLVWDSSTGSLAAKRAGVMILTRPSTAKRLAGMEE